MKRITTEEFIERARKVHGDYYIYDEVDMNNRDEKGRVPIICPIHGRFWQTPNNHLHGQRCYACGKKSMADKQSLTEDEFRERAIKVYGDRYDLSNLGYVSFKKDITPICKEHGVFTINASNFLGGSGCQECANIARRLARSRGLEGFIEDATKVHNGFYTYEHAVYVNNSTNLMITCPIHGDFPQTPSNHIHGKQGCPKCKSSKLELSIISFFDDNGIDYIFHCDNKTFEWLGRQHFDFFIPKYNLALECQGEQHFIGSNFGSKRMTDEEAFELTRERDERKLALCEEHGIKMLYYSDKPYNDSIITDKQKLLEIIESQHISE